MKIPYISNDLIQYLDTIYPNRLPEEVQGDLNQVNNMIGQQQVVAHLRAKHIEQEEDP